MMATLDLVPDNALSNTKRGRVLESSDAMASYRVRIKGGIQPESYTISWSNLSETLIAYLRNIYAFAGNVAPLRWTAPGESTARAWRIRKFQDKAESANTFSASMELVHVPGVPVPAS